MKEIRNEKRRLAYLENTVITLPQSQINFLVRGNEQEHIDEIAMTEANCELIRENDNIDVPSDESDIEN
jgi:hypothetical protein